MRTLPLELYYDIVEFATYTGTRLSIDDTREILRWRLTSRSFDRAVLSRARFNLELHGDRSCRSFLMSVSESCGVMYESVTLWADPWMLGLTSTRRPWDLQVCFGYLTSLKRLEVEWSFSDKQVLARLGRLVQLEELVLLPEGLLSGYCEVNQMYCDGVTWRNALQPLSSLRRFEVLTAEFLFTTDTSAKSRCDAERNLVFSWFGTQPVAARNVVLGYQVLSGSAHLTDEQWCISQWRYEQEQWSHVKAEGVDWIIYGTCSCYRNLSPIFARP